MPIADGFKIVRPKKVEPGEAIVTAGCLKCEHEFDVVMSYLKPVNCSFNIVDDQMTVTCPQCKHSETASTKEEKASEEERKKELAELKDRLNYLATQVARTAKHKNERQLKTVGAVENSKTAAVYMRCSSCAHKFEVDVFKSINCKKIDPYTVALSCPSCNTSDTVGVDGEDALKTIKQHTLEIKLIMKRIKVLET